MTWKPDICVYHAGCDDGFGAAWAIWKRWPDCRFVPGSYGKTANLGEVAGKNVLYVDFSEKRPAIEMLAQAAQSIVIIDHHKTAEAELEPFKTDLPYDPDLMFRDMSEIDRPPIIAWFDMDQSGAVMAWKFAHPDIAVPYFLELIQDRDLWRFHFGNDTKQFSAALKTHPMKFETWDRLSGQWGMLVNDGEAILRAQTVNIEKFLHESYLDKIDGHTVPMVNVPYIFASDTANALLKKYPDAPFAACWSRLKDGRDQFSLRSEDSRMDVSEVAARFGGGGHRNAAGFVIPS
jgi:uncharacterized protein